jgi:Secretion system C-terminal sorting domain
MSRFILFVLILTLPALLFAATLPDTLSGVTSGTTIVNHTYVVRDSLFVNAGDTLRISAGDTLIMASSTGFIQVLGTFICEGTQTNQNLITVPESQANNGPGQWGGIVGDSCKYISVRWTKILWAGGNDYSGHAYRTFDIYSDYANTTQTYFVHNTVIGTVDDCIGLHGGNAIVDSNTIKWCGAPDGDNINIKDGVVGEIAYNVIWSSGGNGIKLNASLSVPRITNMCIHNNTIVAGGWRRIGELGYAILVDKNSRAQIYNNIMGDMYQELEITTKADTTRTVYDNNLFCYSVDSLMGAARYWPSDGVTRQAPHDYIDVQTSALFKSYSPYFTNDWTALDGTNDYRILSTSVAVGHGFTPPAPTPSNYWYNPYFGNTTPLPGASNIGALGVYTVTSVNNGSVNEPIGFKLEQNYPNPFNPTTTIQYVLPREGQVTLKVYNILGQLMQTLVNEVETAGTHNVQFNGSNLASGVYIYKLESGSMNSVSRMLMLK